MKERITIKLDEEILEYFRSKSAETSAPYQTLINKALKEHVQLQTCLANVAQTKEK